MINRYGSLLLVVVLSDLHSCFCDLDCFNRLLKPAGVFQVIISDQVVVLDPASVFIVEERVSNCGLKSRTMIYSLFYCFGAFYVEAADRLRLDYTPHLAE